MKQKQESSKKREDFSPSYKYQERLEQMNSMRDDLTKNHLSKIKEYV